MPRKGENIYKRKDGRWEGRYIIEHIDGKAKYRSVYAHSYTEVKRLLNECKIVKYVPLQTKKVMFADICSEWLLSKKISVKESTHANYICLLNAYILPYFGNIAIDDIDGNIVNAFINKMYSEGKAKTKGGLSPKSVKDLVSVLKQIFKYAEMPDFKPKICTPKVYDSELKVLSRFENNTLVNYMLHNLNMETIGVLIALYTGIRLGELCSLMWKDIDLRDNTINIYKTIQRIKNTDVGATSKTKIIIDTPKSRKSTRKIPIKEFLADILRPLKAKYDENAYILTGSTNRYIEPRLYQVKFKKYIKNAGIPDTNFHCLRHTFATRAVEQGFEIKSLSEILGHSSVKFTLDKYVHSSDRLKRVNIEKLAVNY